MFRQVHNDLNVGLMIATGSQPQIHIVSLFDKFVLLAPAEESIFRALGFYSLSYNVKTQSIDCNVYVLYYGDFGHSDQIGLVAGVSVDKGHLRVHRHRTAVACVQLTGRPFGCYTFNDHEW